MTSPARRWLTRFTSGTAGAGLVLAGLPSALDGAASAPPNYRVHPVIGHPTPATGPAADLATDLRPVSHKREHPHRKIKLYKVRKGDTPSGIAVRYHAWTAELIAMNHSSTLYVGEVIRIPVVVKAARKCTRHQHHRTNYPPGHRQQHDKSGTKAGKNKDHQPKPAKKPDKGKKPKPKHPHKHKDKDKKAHTHRHPHRGWVHAHASRAEVRRLIVTKARRFGVDPELALAIAWQEAGWQHHRVSPAGALGAMQVMPGTGRWMSAYLGRDLNLRNLHHNVTAGVALIRILRGEAGLRYAVAGYYQGLAGVRRYGMYDSTKRYVANVLALKKALERGWNPA